MKIQSDSLRSDDLDCYDNVLMKVDDDKSNFKLMTYTGRVVNFTLNTVRTKTYTVASVTLVT